MKKINRNILLVLFAVVSTFAFAIESNKKCYECPQSAKDGKCVEVPCKPE